MQHYDVVALFSGGLDSIIAAKVVQEQGRSVKALHFTSPFFGKPHLIPKWQEMYGIDIEAVDVGEEYARLMLDPPHGFGKVLNPCVDCKILMLRRARIRMAELGARAIISGEVLGQRPMSQRRDALNIISRDAGVRDVLVRPLCAKRLPPTPPEEAGVLDRDRLLNISGRGRKEQLALAGKYKLPEIPTPAGGCMLAEVESAKRYWPVLKWGDTPSARDFELANLGRQFWKRDNWLTVGRDQADNERIESLAAPGDLLFKVKDFPGPLCLGRQWPGRAWTPEAVREAAALTARYCTKARRHGGEVAVLVASGGETAEVHVEPCEPAGWGTPEWETAKEELAATRT
ncbi:tRNA(5-methylaminomethyl-2-thiouridylate) methyltransferase [Oceanidesulfovibrio indonesiensis]|nr:tRNA(5-methylaminomethyl-2-thiouridylate) methyltransferase [Oceanidesulfovibrio indonesiensis]